MVAQIAATAYHLIDAEVDMSFLDAIPLFIAGEDRKASADKLRSEAYSTGGDGLPVGNRKSPQDAADKHLPGLAFDEPSGDRAAYFKVISKKDGDEKDLLARLTKLVGGTDDSLVDAQTVRDLLKSNNERERAIGKYILDLLNKGTDAECSAAIKVLAVTPDVEYRHQLLRVLTNPETSKGTERLLEMLSAETGKEADAARSLLRMIGGVGPDAVGRVGANDDAARILLRMLGTDDQRNAALTILNKIDDEAARGIMLLLLTEPGLKEVGNRVLSLLQGVPPGFEFEANALLKMRADHGNSEVFDKLFQMLPDADKYRDACAMLSGLRSYERISEFLNLMEKPEYKSGCEQVLAALRRFDPSVSTAYSRLIGLFVPQQDLVSFAFQDGKNYELEDARLLLKMLGNPNDRKAAEAVLSFLSQERDENVSSGTDWYRARKNLLQLFAGEDIHEQGKYVVGMLQDSKYARVAEKALALMGSGFAAAKFLSVYQGLEKKSDKDGLQILTDLLDGKSPGLDRLMLLLCSKEAEDNRVGNKALSMLLGKDYALTRQVLEAGTQFASELDAILDLSKQDKYKNAVGKLLDVLSEKGDDLKFSGPSTIFDMLSSTVPARREAAVSIVEMLADADKEAAAKLILRSRLGYDEMVSAVTLMQSVSDGVNLRLLAQIAADSPDTQKSAETILRMLCSESPVVHGHANHFLKMLNSSEHRATALSVIRMAGDNGRGLEQFLRLIDVDAGSAPEQVKEAQALLSLASSNDPEKLKGLRNLMGMTASAQSTIISMLADAQTQAGALAVLSLDDSTQCSAVVKLLLDPARSKDGQAIIDVLASGRPGQAAGIRAIMTADLDLRLIQGEAIRTSAIIAALSEPATAAIAQDALLLASGSPRGTLAENLLRDAQSRPLIGQLLKMSRDSTTAAEAATIVANLTEPTHVKTLLQCPADSQLRRTVITLLSDGDSNLRLCALRLLNMTVLDDELQKAFLTMLNDNGKKELAVELLSNKSLLRMPGAMISPALLEGIVASDKRLASDYMLQLLQSPQLENRRAVGLLMRMLTSISDQEREEGVRVLRMFNEPRHQNTALRLLKDRLPQPIPLELK
jgi:hypothetical protein